MRYAHDVKVCIDAATDELLLREEQEDQQQQHEDEELQQLLGSDVDDEVSEDSGEEEQEQEQGADGSGVHFTKSGDGEKKTSQKNSNPRHKHRRASGVSIFGTIKNSKKKTSLRSGTSPVTAGCPTTDKHMKRMELQNKRTSMGTSVAYAPDFLMEITSDHQKKATPDSPVLSSSNTSSTSTSSGSGSGSGSNGSAVGSMSPPEQLDEVSDGEDDLVITTEQLKSESLGSVGGDNETKQSSSPPSQHTSRWMKVQGAVNRRAKAEDVLKNMNKGNKKETVVEISWEEMSGNNSRPGVDVTLLADPHLNPVTSGSGSAARRNITVKRKSNTTINWDSEFNDETNELGNYNKFKDMILVSQAADVQLDFMRRICPEYTARQTLQELVIFLTEVFGNGECYITLDIPLLNKDREYALRMCTNSTGGCDVKERKMGGLSEWILETGQSINTGHVIGHDNFHAYLDQVPRALASAGHKPNDYSGYFGFYLAPYDANEEEKMCIVVGVRLMRPVLPKEEAMVRGLTLTAMAGISFQQFGACSQIAGKWQWTVLVVM